MLSSSEPLLPRDVRSVARNRAIMGLLRNSFARRGRLSRDLDGSDVRVYKRALPCVNACATPVVDRASHPKPAPPAAPEIRAIPARAPS